NQDGVVWSTQVKRCKRRHKGQAQDADTLGPKGTWPGPEAPNSSGAVVEPPAERPLTPLTLSARSLFSASSPICLPCRGRRGRAACGWPTAAHARVMDLLYPLDQMVAAPGSVATVVFQWDGHRERIQASSCATIACNECTPAGITELRRAVHAAVVAKGKKIRPLARSGRGAAVEVR